MLKNVQEDSNTVKDGLSAKEKQQYAKKKEDQLKRIQEWKVCSFLLKPIIVKLLENLLI